MTSVLSAAGKYRPRKDWSTSSIPQLVALDEEESTQCDSILSPNGINKTVKTADVQGTLPPIKPPRRSSLAMGLLAGRGIDNHNNSNDLITNNEKNTKRRSSIAIAFLGRRDNSHKEKRRRRSSWHAKLERRRRKVSSANQMDDICDVDVPENDIINENDTTITGGNSSYEYNRQKRHSWWNIFVPENLKQRSRRASQDVGVLSRSDENIIPFRRSKSRSVDHGLAAPFDLDSLRSKVEGRFESIDRLSKDGDKKKLPMPIIPTISYTVGDHDTLTSVAARFDTTPSELTALNRLASSFIYSGQHLLVPDKSGKDNDNASSTGDGSQHSGTSSPEGGRHRKGSTDDLPQEEKELLEGLRPGSPKPGHIERISSPHTQNDDDPVTTQRFLKINVRHITDGQGVVGGVLLVTPNAVMFDPNVSDPLVIEHGPESYGVIAPMELVVNAAIFHDIAHMRVGGGESQSTEKPEIYHPKSCSRCENTHSPGKDSLLVKDETFPELGMGSVEACDDQESVCSSNEREGDAFPKAFERDLVTPTNLQQKSQGDNLVNGGSGENKTGGNEQTKDKLDTTTDKEKGDTRTLEERRRSLIDHHWAVPSKDKSLDDEDETGAAKSSDGDSGGVANSVETDSAIKIPLVTSVPPEIPPAIVAAVAAAAAAGPIDEDNSQLVKLSCHDSGIDIRDPNSLPTVPAIPTKKVYSDADIVLSSEWVPPLTIAPSHFTDTSSTNRLSTQSSLTSTTTGLSDGGRKKTTSVSFSIEDGGDSINNIITEKVVGEKKNKMLKRLSYPLTWVEGLTGEGNKSSESSDSAPNTGDSNQSVFSKVFSSSPITLVSEFGGNLFLSKTPSEDSGGSPVPPITPFEGSNSGAGGHMAIGRSSIGTFIRPHSESGSSQSKPMKPTQPRLDYRSMVSIDDMPELFASFDMRAPLFPQLDHLELIPRPARACPDPPLYLRLRMGRPIGKAIPLPTSVMSYGKNKLRPEYWFSIPKNRVDELYRFLNSWVPQLYGELDEEHVTARGYELIQHDTEFTRSGSPTKDGRSNSDGEITELTRESWELLKAPYVKIYNIIKSQTGSNDLEGCEVLSMSTDDYRKASLFAPGSFDQDFPIPELIGQTEILTEEHREKLCGHLPARAEGYSWSLVFSTSLHGFSLNSLYRKMQRLESPVLIVIQDTDNNVFGALTSCSLHVSDHFYGTGESLLYKFNPSFKVFHWSGENLYFIKGNPESLAIGAGDGIFGLWLDGDLNLGRSQRCSTYSNEPLSPQEDFVVKTLECWAFV